MKFKKGDRIRLRKDSDLYNQCPNQEGVITSPDTVYERVQWYCCKFDNGYTNSYREADMELIITEITDWSEEFK